MTCLNLRTSRPAAAVLCAALMGVLGAGCATMGVPQPQKPPRSAEEVKARLAILLQQMGDVSHYVARVGDDGTIYVGLTGSHSACTDVPKPTVLNEYVDRERLERLRFALEAMNQNNLNRQPTKVQALPGACLQP